MAPASAGLLAGIPASHLPGLLGGAVALVLAAALHRRWRRLDAIGVLLLVTAGIHLGLAAGHVATAPALSSWFLLDGVAFLAVAGLPHGASAPGWPRARGLGVAYELLLLVSRVADGLLLHNDDLVAVLFGGVLPATLLWLLRRPGSPAGSAGVDRLPRGPPGSP